MALDFSVIEIIVFAPVNSLRVRGSYILEIIIKIKAFIDSITAHAVQIDHGPEIRLGHTGKTAPFEFGNNVQMLGGVQFRFCF